MKTHIDNTIEEIIRKIAFRAWELGKEQVKTPHSYTLGSDEWEKELKDYWEEIQAQSKRYADERVRSLSKKIDGMIFLKDKSDITQRYQSTFTDGYNQAIEVVVEFLNQDTESEKGVK